MHYISNKYMITDDLRNIDINKVFGEKKSKLFHEEY